MVKTVFPVGYIRMHRMVLVVSLFIEGWGTREYWCEFTAGGDLVTIEQNFGGEEMISLQELAHEYMEHMGLDVDDETAVALTTQMLRRGVSA